MRKPSKIEKSNFFAADLFLKWEKMISLAKSSIVVYTPYLDSTLVRLLSKNQEDIIKIVVTSLEGENLFQRGYQLEALKELFNSGVVIKNLEGLHAKVLIIDDEFISLGSQNFTNRGRKNYEAGFLSKYSFANSKLIEKLDVWKFNAHEVSVNLIDSLIEYLNRNEDDLKAIKRRFEEGIQNILNQHKEEEIDIQFNQSEYYNTTFRFEQEEVILTKRIPPPYDYYSFFANKYNNLCEWIKTDSEGKKERFSLKGYDYYLALNSNSKKLAFLRLHTTRITFMITEFNSNPGFGLFLQSNEFKVIFNLPRKNTKVANIRVKLMNEKIGKAELYYLFDSIKFKLVKTVFSSEKCEVMIKKHFLRKQKKVDKFLLNQIKPYRFTTSWGQDKEIERFLPKDSYRVGIMEFKECPILIFEENKR